jgi:hypothetical protein
MDPVSGDIVGMKMTEAHVSDHAVIPELLNPITNPVERCMADGA